MTGADEIERWAASGCLALTGRPDGPPLGPPGGFVSELDLIADDLAAGSARLGRRVTVDPLGLLAERAAIADFRRAGTTSCGGATRLVPAVDGWLAVSLPRDDDAELVPAWLGVEPEIDDPWSTVATAVAGLPAAEVVRAGAELGLAVAVLGEHDVTVPPFRRIADAPPAIDAGEVVVAELGSLWAAPLCGSLLADAGAQVLKIESTGRPDGARRGPTRFHDLLNAGKRSVTLDFGEADGRARLRTLLAQVDVVLESSRPRALTQLGVDATDLLGTARPSVWLSITAHGRAGRGAGRVGFGDDAAVAGGLVAWEDGEPRFLVDAVADPLTGLVGAGTVVDLLGRGGSWLVDLPMAGVAARFAGPTLPVPTDLAALPPVDRRERGRAAPFGAHTEDVVDGLGRTR